MPTRDEIVRVCDQYCAAVTARDADAIVALFAEGAKQFEPIGAEPNVGHEAIRAFFTRNPQVGLDVSRLGPVNVAGRHAAMQIRVEVLRDGVTHLMSSTDVIEFDDDGKIVSMIAIPDRDAHPDDTGRPSVGPTAG
jgi:steroid delta-isomerase